MKQAPTLVPVLLAAVAGGLVALTLRELLRATPSLARWLTEAVEPLRRAGTEGYEASEVERRRLGVIGAIVLIVVGGWLAGPAGALPLGVAGPATVAWLFSTRADRYRRGVEHGLPALATATADALAAGRSARAALLGAGCSLEGPASAELARVAADLDLGASLSDALGDLRVRVASPRVDAFAAAMLSQRVAGGDLVAVLRRFAAAARERAHVESEARSATAQARFTGLLVVAMPAGAALLAELLAPGFVAGLLANPTSLALLGAAGALQLAGFAAIRRLGRVRA